MSGTQEESEAALDCYTQANEANVARAKFSGMYHYLFTSSLLSKYFLTSMLFDFDHGGGSSLRSRVSGRDIQKKNDTCYQSYDG